MIVLVVVLVIEGLKIEDEDGPAGETPALPVILMGQEIEDEDEDEDELKT